MTLCSCTFPPGANVCHCTGCHRNFGGVAAFDKHLAGPLGARDHIDPPGHQLDDRGVWTAGDPESYRTRKARMLAIRGVPAVQGASGGSDES